MSKFRTRLVKRLLATAAAAAIGVTVLPAVPAHATYGPQNGIVHLQLLDSVGSHIGSIDGTVEFDDGNTKYRYSLTVCRQSSFTAPFAYVYVNGAYQFPLLPSYTALPACGGALGGVVSGEVVSGSVVQNVTVEFHGSSYGYPAGFEQRQKSVVKDNPYN
jgi:hypothetical protein